MFCECFANVSIVSHPDVTLRCAGSAQLIYCCVCHCTSVLNILVAFLPLTSLSCTMAAPQYSYDNVYRIFRPPHRIPFVPPEGMYFHDFDFITTERLPTVQKWLNGEIWGEDAPENCPMTFLYIDEGTRVQPGWGSSWIQPVNAQFPIALDGQFGEAKLDGLYLYSETEGLTPMTTLDLPGAGTRGVLHSV
jgi:hypothetical protein